MHLLRRLSLFGGMTLALAGCAHHSEVIVIREQVPLEHGMVEHGLRDTPSPSVCCLDMSYPGAWLWLEHCQSARSCSFHGTARGHFLGDLHGNSQLGGRCANPCQDACQCQRVFQPGILRAPSPCAGGIEIPRPVVLSDPRDMAVPPASPYRRQPDEVPPQFEQTTPTSIEPTILHPEDDALQLEAPQVPQAEASPPKPPTNNMPSRSHRRKPPQETSPVRASQPSQEPTEVELPTNEIPRSEIPASETPPIELPRNELPTMRLKLKASSERIELNSADD